MVKFVGRQNFHKEMPRGRLGSCPRAVVVKPLAAAKTAKAAEVINDGGQPASLVYEEKG